MIQLRKMIFILCVAISLLLKSVHSNQENAFSNGLHGFEFYAADTTNTRNISLGSIFASITQNDNYDCIINDDITTKDATRGNIQSTHTEEYFIPITTIKDTDLFTGIFYQIKLKNTPHWVTWSRRALTIPNGPRERHHMLNTASSSHISKLPKHEWLFETTDADNSWYFMRNNDVLPKHIIQFIKIQKPGSSPCNSEEDIKSRYSFIEETPNGFCTFERILGISYSTDSEENGYLKPIQESNTTSYKLYSKKYNGLVTRIGYEIIVHENSNDVEFYKPNMKWYDDALFELKAPEIKLQAHITQIEFKPFPVTPAIGGRSHGTLVDKFILYNKGHSSRKIPSKLRHIDLSHENTFMCGLQNKTLKLLGELNSTVSVPLYFNRFAAVEALVPVNYSLCEQRTNGTKYGVVIELPPLSGAEVSIFLEEVSFEIPFVAHLSITGETDRMLKANNEVLLAKVPATIVEKILKTKNFRSEIISSSDHVVNISVSGIFKASYGIQANTIVKEIRSHEKRSEIVREITLLQNCLNDAVL